MKMQVAFLGLLLPMAMLLSACGEGGSVVTTTTSPITTTTVETTTAKTTTTVTTTATTTTTRKTAPTRTTTTTHEVKPTAKATTTVETTTTTTQKVPAATTRIATAVETTTTERTTVIKTPIWRTTAPPSYSMPVVPAVFREEDLRTDLEPVLGHQVYYSAREMTVQVKNTTDRKVTVDLGTYAVLKKKENGEWEYVYKKESYRLRVLEPEEVYQGKLFIGPFNFTKEMLDVGEYKLLLAVDGQWNGVDFCVVTRPTLNTTVPFQFFPQGQRSDLTITLKKTVFTLNEELRYSVKNTTDDQLILECGIMEKMPDGTWEKREPGHPFGRTFVSAGAVCESWVFLADCPLEEGHSYLLVIDTGDGGWIGADFTVE